MTVQYTVVHLFSGSGGCSLGFQREGFKTLAAIDNDADACADLDYLLGERVSVCADIAAMEPADLRRIVGERRPDVIVLTPPCKSWSKCLPKRSRVSAKYQAMSTLAVRGAWLAMHTWPDEPPPLIVIENVRGMNIEGRELMRIIEDEMSALGYLFDIRVHNVGEVGGLAQNRHRCLFVARDQAQIPAFLKLPPSQRVRPVGDELGKLPPPIMDKRSDSMHKLPQLSALNWLRIALIPAGKDWKALPERVRLGGEATGRRDGKFGVERWDDAAHCVTGTGNRVPSGWSAVADPRLPPRDQRKNGGFGVNAWSDPAHAVLAEGSVRNTWASVSSPLPRVRPGVVARAWAGRRRAVCRSIDPRLTCTQWSGAYGVCSPDEPSPTIVGHHKHDRAPASYADPRLDHAPRNGSFGVIANDAPAPAVRGHHEVRQAPGAFADPRVPWDHAEHGGRPHNYGVQRWDAPASTIKGKQVVQNSRAAVAHPEYPTPTHRIVRDADGELVLHGPPIDLDDDRPCYLVIEAEDGTWHRPMTDLELAVLQSLPAYHRGEMLALRGPSGKRREHIGNMLPTLAAQAIARECRATLDAAGDGFQLVGGGAIWVTPEEHVPC